MSNGLDNSGWQNFNSDALNHSMFPLDRPRRADLAGATAKYNSADWRYSLDQSYFNWRGENSKIDDQLGFEMLCNQVFQIGFNIGLAYTRNPDFKTMAEMRDCYRKLRSQHQTLLSRYPDLLEALNSKALSHGIELGKEALLSAERECVKINSALRGIKNINRLANIYENKTDLELRVLEQAYLDRYAETPYQTASKCRFLLRGVRRDQVLSMTQGDKAAALAYRIKAALCPLLGKRTAEVLKLYSSTSPEGLEQAELYFNEHIAPGLSVRIYPGRKHNIKSLDQLLKLCFSSTEYRCLGRYRDGDMLGAKVLRLSDAVRADRKDIWTICEVLEQTPLVEMPDLMRRYLYETGIPFREDLKIMRSAIQCRNVWQRLRSCIPLVGKGRGEEIYCERALALANSDSFNADLAKLRAGMLKLRGEWVGEVFVNKYYELQRVDTDSCGRRYRAYSQKLVEAYGENFWDDLRQAVRKLGTWKEKYSLMKRLVKVGRLGKGGLARSCMIGFGTDEKGLIELISNCSERELARIERRFRRYKQFNFFEGRLLHPVVVLRNIFRFCRDGLHTFIETTIKESPRNYWPNGWKRFEARTLTLRRDLWADIESELDGGDWERVRLSRTGPPKNILEKYQRVKKRYRVERSPRGTISLVEFLGGTREGLILDRDFQRAQRFYRKRIKGKEKISYSTQLQFDNMLERLSMGFESFRKTKYTVAQTASNLLSGLASLAASSAVLGYGTKLYVTAALTTVAVNLLTRIGIKLAGLGRPEYGREQLGWDILWATAEGIVLIGRLARLGGPMLRSFLGTPLGREISMATRGVTKFLFKTVVNKTRDATRARKSQHLLYLKAARDPKGSKTNYHEIDWNQRLKELSLYA